MGDGGSDSFSDEEECFRLYSTKSVTANFREHLKKASTADNSIATKNHNCEKTFVKELGKISPAKNLSGKLTVLDENESFKKTEYCNIQAEPEKIMQSPKDDETDICGGFSPRRSSRLKKTAVHDVETTIIGKQAKGRKGHAQEKSLEQSSSVVEVLNLDDHIDSGEHDLLNDSDLNSEMTVKVIWKSVRVKKFFLRKFQKLSVIYKHYMEEENLPEDKLIFTLHNSRVNPSDTPDSLNLQICDFIEGGILSETNNEYVAPVQRSITMSHHNLKIKFQDSQKNITLSMNKNEAIKVIMLKYAEQVEVPLSKIKFLIDGEEINNSETGASLDLEDGDVIDVVFM